MATGPKLLNEGALPEYVLPHLAAALREETVEVHEKGHIGQVPCVPVL